jgi:hypothetical protein
VVNAAALFCAGQAQVNIRRPLLSPVRPQAPCQPGGRSDVLEPCKSQAGMLSSGDTLTGLSRANRGPGIRRPDCFSSLARAIRAPKRYESREIIWDYPYDSRRATTVLLQFAPRNYSYAASKRWERCKSPSRVRELVRGGARWGYLGMRARTFDIGPTGHCEQANRAVGTVDNQNMG